MINGIPIKSATSVLWEVYDEEYFFSYKDLYIQALRDGVVTKDEFETAKKYYRNLWDYLG